METSDSDCMAGTPNRCQVLLLLICLPSEWDSMDWVAQILHLGFFFSLGSYGKINEFFG